MILHRAQAGTFVQTFQPYNGQTGYQGLTFSRDTKGGYGMGEFTIPVNPRSASSRLIPGQVVEWWHMGSCLYHGVVVGRKSTGDGGYVIKTDGCLAFWAKKTPADMSYTNKVASFVIGDLLTAAGPQTYPGFGATVVSQAATYISTTTNAIAGTQTFSKQTMQEVINNYNNLEGYEWGGQIINPTAMPPIVHMYYGAADRTTVHCSVTASDLPDTPQLEQDFEGYGNTVRIYHAGVGGGSYGGQADADGVAKYGTIWKQLDISGGGGTGETEANAVGAAYLARIDVDGTAEPWLKGSITISEGTKSFSGAGIPSIYHIRPGMNIQINGLPDIMPELLGSVDNTTLFHIDSADYKPAEGFVTLNLNEPTDDVARIVARKQNAA